MFFRRQALLTLFATGAVAAAFVAQPRAPVVATPASFGVLPTAFDPRHQRRGGRCLFGDVAAAEAASEEDTAAADEVDAVAEAAAPVEAAAPAEDEAAKEGASESAPEPTAYVGNLAFETEDDAVRDAFAPYGTVVKVTVPRDRNTGRTRGFAFVLMSSKEELDAAIEAVNETDINGRTVYVSESLPKDQVQKSKKKYQKKREPLGSKLYVGNISFDTPIEAVQEYFSQYGEVLDLYMPTDINTGNPRGFAFLTMSEEDALKTIDITDGVEFEGRTLTVNKSLPKGTKAPPRERKPSNMKLYVGNLSWGTELDSVRELFEEYGSVVDCYMPMDRETGQGRGFAFVTMAPEDAMRAADETDGYEMDGRILRVNEAQPKGYSPGYDSEGYGYDDGAADGDSWGDEGDDSWGADSY